MDIAQNQNKSLKNIDYSLYENLLQKISSVKLEHIKDELNNNVYEVNSYLKELELLFSQEKKY